MSVTKQLYQLHEVDQEIKSSEQILRQLTGKLGESQALAEARAELTREHQYLAELEGRQHTVEWETDGIVDKLTSTEENLYSGQVKNPKELTNLQHEIDGLKMRRNQLEDKSLEIMDQIEHATAKATTISSQLKKLESEWHSQQKKLSTEIERFTTVLGNLEHRRQLLSTDIDHQVIELYQKLRNEKGTAIAKVEQGICSGCRISLPTTDLQRVRSGSVVQCSSCGRILFLA